MKRHVQRQTDLLTFFHKSQNNSRNTNLNSEAMNERSSNADTIAVSPILVDGPGAAHPKMPSPHQTVHTSAILTSKPILLPVRSAYGLQTSTLLSKRSIRRRSSLVVRRQMKLAEKYNEQVALNVQPACNSPTAQSNVKIKAAAKLRRGNYDCLNYAPMDQLKSESTSLVENSLCQTLSKRSRLMVSKALCISRETPEIPKCNRRIPKHTGSRYHSQRSHRFTSVEKCDNVCAGRQSPPPPKPSSKSTEALHELPGLPQGVDIPTSVAMGFSHFPDHLPSKVGTKSDSGRQLYMSLSNDENQNPTGDEDSFAHLDLSDWTAHSEAVTEAFTDPNCIGNLTEATPLPNQPFYRGIITAIERHSKRLLGSVSLNPTSATSCCHPHELVTIELLDSWADVDLRVDDVVHIIPGLGSSIHERHFVIGDGETSRTYSTLIDIVPACLVQHPDMLISGTKLVGNFLCTRRSVLEQFWTGHEDADVGNGQSVTTGRVCGSTSESGRLMLLGSLVHELFQKLILMDSPTPHSGRDLVDNFLQRPETALHLYACAYPVDEMRSALSTFVTKILRWIQENCIHTYGIIGKETCLSRPLVQEVVDVEENIWSTRFGLKGKVDLSILCRLPKLATNRLSTLTAVDDKSVTTSLIPLELKTGRPTYSLEHKGQVLLYMLMLLDRYGPKYTPLSGDIVDTASAGWLVYLQDDAADRSHSSVPAGIVIPQTASFRGLLQTRNTLATHLHIMIEGVMKHEGEVKGSWMPTLPPPTKQLRICQSCPMQLVCSLFDSSVAKTHDPASSVPDAYTTVAGLLLSKRAHLSVSHVRFFAHWCHSLLLEYAASERVGDVLARIIITSPKCTSKQSLPKFTHPNVIRCLKAADSTPCEGIHYGQWSTLLLPQDTPVFPFSLTSFECGDWVIVSSEDGRHIGLTLATISDIGANATDGIRIQTDRPLPKWIDAFRLDRYISSKSTQINLSNLACLMHSSSICDHLRSIVIDGAPPVFGATLSKQVVTSIRGILKHLNTCQRTAILRVLMANHYVLIKGYPGTGKTETLSSLLRVLIRLDQKILVVAHTHSAVDTLLVRLVKFGEQNIVRLGSVDRVNPRLTKYCLHYLLTKHTQQFPTQDPVEFIREKMERAAVVGCTALAAGGGMARHEALCYTRFDVVIMDEATQLLLPTAIGALLCLRSSESQSTLPGRFVLVGDPHQLPPLVRSSKARLAGLDRSLFTHLLAFCEGTVTSPEEDGFRVNSNGPVVELNIQYRMNAPILHLANTLSYSGSIRAVNDAVANATVADQLRVPLPELLPSQCDPPPWLKRSLSQLLTDSALFLDTHRWNRHSQLRSETRKYSNESEAKLVELIVRLAVSCGLNPSDVGVIAPHRSQVALVRRMLDGHTDRSNQNLSSVEVNTVDQFQGRDKRMIVLSLTVCTLHCLNSSALVQDNDPVCPKNLLEDRARLTVAITRAKHKLLIVGCSGCGNDVSHLSPTPSFDGSQPVLGELFGLLRHSCNVEVLDEADHKFVNEFRHL